MMTLIFDIKMKCLKICHIVFLFMLIEIFICHGSRFGMESSPGYMTKYRMAQEASSTSSSQKESSTENRNSIPGMEDETADSTVPGEFLQIEKASNEQVEMNNNRHSNLIHHFSPHQNENSLKNDPRRTSTTHVQKNFDDDLSHFERFVSPILAFPRDGRVKKDHRSRDHIDAIPYLDIRWLPTILLYIACMLSIFIAYLTTTRRTWPMEKFFVNKLRKEIKDNERRKNNLQNNNLNRSPLLNANNENENENNNDNNNNDQNSDDEQNDEQNLHDDNFDDEINVEEQDEVVDAKEGQEKSSSSKKKPDENDSNSKKDKKKKKKKKDEEREPHHEKHDHTEHGGGHGHDAHGTPHGHVPPKPLHWGVVHENMILWIIFAICVAFAVASVKYVFEFQVIEPLSEGTRQWIDEGKTFKWGGHEEEHEEHGKEHGEHGKHGAGEHGNSTTEGGEHGKNSTTEGGEHGKSTETGEHGKSSNNTNTSHPIVNNITTTTGSTTAATTENHSAFLQDANQLNLDRRGRRSTTETTTKKEEGTAKASGEAHGKEEKKEGEHGKEEKKEGEHGTEEKKEGEHGKEGEHKKEEKQPWKTLLWKNAVAISIAGFICFFFFFFTDDVKGSGGNAAKQAMKLGYKN